MSHSRKCSVYIIESELTHNLYIGVTYDLRERLDQHNSGKNKSTKHGIPWKVIGVKVVEDKSAAYTLEKRLKRWKRPDRVRTWIIRENLTPSLKLNI